MEKECIEIRVELKLKEDEGRELARILDCTQASLIDELQPYANAAVEELINMFLGQNVFTRGSDILEYRLFLLIRHAFGGKIPDVQEVCKLFQLTSSASRSLIRAVMSKYQYSLKSEIDDTLCALLNNAKVSEDKDIVTVAVHNMNLVDELNRVLAGIDTDLSPVRKRRGSVSTYVILPDSYKKLCTEFNIECKL